MQPKVIIRNTFMIFIGSMVITSLVIKGLLMVAGKDVKKEEHDILTGQQQFQKAQLSVFSSKGAAHAFASEHFVPCAIADHRGCMAKAISGAAKVKDNQFAREVFIAALEWDTEWITKQTSCDAQKAGYIDAQFDYCASLGALKKDI